MSFSHSVSIACAAVWPSVCLALYCSSFTVRPNSCSCASARGVTAVARLSENSASNMLHFHCAENVPKAPSVVWPMPRFGVVTARRKAGSSSWLTSSLSQARVFEQALRRAQIPYKVSGGQSFFDKAEIKDLCAWLRLLVNQDDDPAFLRAVTTPKRGIGHQTLGALGTFSAQWKCSMFEALFSESLATALTKRALDGLHEFGRAVNELQYKAKHTEGHTAAHALLTEWLKDIAYEAHLLDNEENEKVAQARWGNVLDFVDWIAKRCGGQHSEEGGVSFTEPKQSVLDVAQTISVILSLAERGEEQDQVTLTTLHASKGLEWPHVVLAGVNEGLLPFKREEAELTAEALQEERRLMYVGITLSLIHI